MGRFSKRSLEGELLIDHSASPGVKADEVGGFSEVVVGGGQRFEEAIYACSHCACVIVKNPDRTRAREWCRYCDKYICDACGYRLTRTLRCDAVVARVEQVYEELERGVPPALLTKL